MGSRLEKNSSAVRKRIAEHTFSDEAGEEYEASAFGGFGDYFRRKKIKLQNLDAELRASSEDRPQIFKGVVAHVSGYTQPPLHVLHKQLVRHGAGFIQYLDSKTMATHIIASALPPKKSVEFSRYRIVKPAWVVDSIAAGRMLPWSDYRVIDEGPRQKLIKFDDGRLSSQVNTPQRSYREQTQNSFYTSQFRSPASPTNRGISRSSPAFQQSTPSKPTPSRLQHLKNIEDDDEEEKEEEEAYMLVAPDKDPSSPTAMPSLPVPDNVGNSTTMPMKMDGNVHAKKSTAQASSDASEDPSMPPDICTAQDAMTANSPKEPMTSEEHNARLLSDEKIRKSSTANPDFLKQFYGESRLHHLSTWKAGLKSEMQRQANEKGPTKPTKRRPGARRYIMHVDFDSFFCAVSLKSAPAYMDKPVVVAHSTGGGSEIASCNYPAREFGVKNGMWMKRALELCPEIKVLPYDFPAYEEASKLFYAAILELGGVVQSVSIDEALVDITTLVLEASASTGVGVSEGSIWREQEKANDIATKLREQVKIATGCNVSVGIGGNILLAKVALRRAKPAGQYQIKPEEVLDVLSELKVEDLPGVAYSIGGRLEEIGVRLVKDIRDLSKQRLTSVLGPKTGEKLWEYARGIDRAEVGHQPLRKSVSAEVNWGIRFINQQEAEEFVMNLCKELEKRLLNEQVKGKHLTMKIMRRSLDAPLDPPKHLGHGKCDTFNKSTVFGVATHDAESIGKEAVRILRSFSFSPGDLRGLGVQLQKLEPVKGSAAPEGSQKRLRFGAHAAGASAEKQRQGDPIEDGGSPEKARTASAGREMSADPIAEDPLTPRKPKPKPSVHPALALARTNEADEMAKTPMNMMGTQFVMPSHPDAAVIAELPQDIRSRLMAQQPKSVTPRETSPAQQHVSPGGARPRVADDIPADIDPEVFNALPDDMKAEVLASYGNRQGQRVLPQSPRRDRIINRPQEKHSPSKRGGIRGMLGRARERQRDASSGLLQTNFVTGNTRAAEDAFQDVDEMEELNADFLAELPEEVRKEVIDDHRRRRLAQRSGLDFQAPQRRGGWGRDNEGTLPGGQTKICFPGRPPKVAFTTSSLTSVAEIKDMLNAWHRETRDEGPHQGDVQVFEKYLARVVSEERDMEKARKLLTWLGWVVGEDERDSRGSRAWQSALAGLKDAVQTAVKSRGLGPLDL